MRTSRPRNKATGMRLIALGLILITVVVLTDIRVRPIIKKAGGYQCQVIATRIINQAVHNELENGRYDYMSLVLLTFDETGNITSIQSNMVNINRLKTRVSEYINEDMAKIDSRDLKIPVGTISGINLLYGRGPAVPVQLTPRGYAGINLVSKFSSAGINQTHHQIIMTVSVDISAIIPGYTTSVTVDTEFIVAETIIVGYIPESYTHIIIG